MKTLRFINSGPADGPTNMAIDEALFNELISVNSLPPVFRTYTWSRPCVTIGYFQKYTDFVSIDLSITRRMTGGLSVVHEKDVSYCFVADDSSFEHIYDQETTYKVIHCAFQKALSLCGLESHFYSKHTINGTTGTATGICVQTLYPYDLLIGRKKVAGSCQRRRGKTLLVQGSVHLPPVISSQSFTAALRNCLGTVLEKHILEHKYGNNIIDNTAFLVKDKYTNTKWNNKY